MAKILFVMTGADGWTLADGTIHRTGFWAEEAVVPLEPVRERCFMLLLDLSAGAAAWFVRCPSAARVVDRSAGGRAAAS